MFVVGESYSRAKDIHDQFGGSRQSGISPSKSHPFIFLFTGDSGETYGYEDGWQKDDGVFHFDFGFQIVATVLSVYSLYIGSIIQLFNLCRSHL